MGKDRGPIVDVDKRTITIKFPFLQIGPIPFLRAVDIAKEPLIIKDILSRLFVDKQEMWFDSSAEVIPAVKCSIKDFQKECIVVVMATIFHVL